LQRVQHPPLRDVRAGVPLAVKVYAALGLVDLGFTLLALEHGYQEANPILAWYEQHGLFEVAKLFATIAVIALAFFLWRMPLVRVILIVANIVMGIVALYHASFWGLHLAGLWPAVEAL
jgi:hypothetical protein